MHVSAELSAQVRLVKAGLAILPVIVSLACAAAPTAPTAAGTATAGASTNLESSLSFCTEEINRYRARAGVAAVNRSADLESFAATAAEHDGKSGVPHQYFRMTNGGGVAIAENQLLLWKGYAVNDVIRQGLAQMWAEGPTGSHYQILLGQYGQVGCGIFTSGNEVNVSQDFR